MWPLRNAPPRWDPILLLKLDQFDRTGFSSREPWSYCDAIDTRVVKLRVPMWWDLSVATPFRRPPVTLNPSFLFGKGTAYLLRQHTRFRSTICFLCLPWVRIWQNRYLVVRSRPDLFVVSIDPPFFFYIFALFLTAGKIISRRIRINNSCCHFCWYCDCDHCKPLDHNAWRRLLLRRQTESIGVVATLAIDRRRRRRQPHHHQETTFEGGGWAPLEDVWDFKRGVVSVPCSLSRSLVAEASPAPKLLLTFLGVLINNLSSFQARPMWSAAQDERSL